MNKPDKPPPRASRLRLWHRRIGLGAAALVAVLALSGIALNHSAGLGLDQRHFTAPWLMRWYGLSPGGGALGYEAGGHWLIALDNKLFLDTKLLAHPVNRIVGAVALNDMLIAAGPTELLLLTGDGALIERITALPTPLLKLGLTAQGRAAIAVAPDRVFTSDAALLEWRRSHEREITWAAPGPPPEGFRQAFLARYHGGGLSLERILLDVHSGRILGRFGPWLMDGAAILLLGLAATGLFAWRLGNRNDANAE